jgi:hypothetical protein
MLAATLGLSACAVQATGYSEQVARPLQEQVLAVANGAAAGQPDVSLTRLNELVASLTDARARGTVSSERYESITAAIALVRGDLEAAITAQNEQLQQQQQKNPGKPKDEKPPKGPTKKP